MRIDERDLWVANVNNNRDYWKCRFDDVGQLAFNTRVDAIKHLYLQDSIWTSKLLRNDDFIKDLSRSEKLELSRWLSNDRGATVDQK